MSNKDIAIKVENLSKRYRIGLKEKMHDSLSGAIFNFIKSPLRNYRKYRSLYRFDDINSDPNSNSSDIIWALKDLSFQIERGEMLGIIGRNGAGKSTLLKVLSRVTSPTSGRAEIHGKVSSLLEVGTGFHAELTGKENVYLNGTILGMAKNEIDRKFDDIVGFSGVEKFIDTPVKRYSSGMLIRLAFSVAAFLEPEILIIDEVLAVGDAEFQKKCVAKMKDIGNSGDTVLLVSHNMNAITRLCERTILISDGKVILDGPSRNVVSAYLGYEFGKNAEKLWPDPAKAPGGEAARLCAVRVKREDGRTTDVVDIRQPVGIEMEYEVIRTGYVLSSYFDFHNEEGVHAFSAVDLDPSWRKRPRPTGKYTSTVWIPGNLLSEGSMFVLAGLASMDPAINQFNEPDVVAFQVVDSLDGDSARGDFVDDWGGVVRPLLTWNTQFISTDREAAVPSAERKS